MKNINFKKQLITLLLCIAYISANAQGVVVYKKDGTKIKVPYEQLDSISTYNYDDEPGISDGESGNITTETFENKTFTVDGVSFTMIAVKAGSFQMGSTTGDRDEKPVHNVTITKDYYIGETEVTQALWMAVIGNPPTSSGFMSQGDNNPANLTSYKDVQSFITKLNEKTGLNFRMPTEAEWEYAARGGNKSKGYTYSGSNTIDNVAWYSENSDKAHPVKTKLPNELGIYDMTGNVSEWCSDWYNSSYYSSSPSFDPVGPSSGSKRVVRGGDWYSSARYNRIAERTSEEPQMHVHCFGFRLALSSSN